MFFAAVPARALPLHMHRAQPPWETVLNLPALQRCQFVIMRAHDRIPGEKRTRIARVLSERSRRAPPLSKKSAG